MKRSIFIKSLLGGIILLTIFSFSYKYWFAPTQILFVNIPEAQAADITLNSDSRYIKITCMSTEEVACFEGYDAVILFGRGLHLAEEHIAALEKVAEDGIPILTISSNAAFFGLNYNLTRKQQSKLLSYFNNPNLKNYRNGLCYICQVANPKHFFQESYDEPIILPDNHFYHREYGEYFNTKEGLIDYLKHKGIYNDKGKNIAFIAGARFPMEGNRAHVDTLIYPIFVLNHQPNHLEEEVSANVDIALYGHTHDGQIFPFTHILRAWYNLSAGYEKLNNTHIFVSSGLGGIPQFRIGSESEIIVVNCTFTKKKN